MHSLFPLMKLDEESLEDFINRWELLFEQNEQEIIDERVEVISECLQVTQEQRHSLEQIQVDV